MTEQYKKNESLFRDSEYVQELWDQFYPRLKNAVSNRVRSIRRAVASDSEIALSAFNSFVRRAKDGRFPQLTDQDELWRLLKTIAIRKANDARKALKAKKRGGDYVVYGQADMAVDSDGAGGVEAVAASQTAPSIDLEVSELFNSLLNKLPDDRHRDVLLLKLQGASVAEIAECLSTSTRTIQRLLKKIEEEWQSDLFEK